MCRSAVHAVLEAALRLVTSSAAVDAKLYGTVMLRARYMSACNFQTVAVCSAMHKLDCVPMLNLHACSTAMFTYSRL
jgi:hypothetical protein